MSSPPAVVGVVMGSSSDWETLRAATEILAEFGIPHEARVVSAHRMPDEMFATFAIGSAGASNAALFAVAMLAHGDAALQKKLDAFRARQSDAARAMSAELK